MTVISDALDGLDRRRLEELQRQIDRRLRACTTCGGDGAIPCRVTARLPTNTAFALLLCRPCIERHRLPESRSESAADCGYIHDSGELCTKVGPHVHEVQP